MAFYPEQLGVLLYKKPAKHKYSCVTLQRSVSDGLLNQHVFLQKTLDFELISLCFVFKCLLRFDGFIESLANTSPQITHSGFDTPPSFIATKLN